MKTYRLKDLLKKEVLIVELPQNGYYSLSENGLNIRDCNSCLLANIKGHYTLLGKCDELKDEDVKDLVKVVMGKFYMNYNDDETDPYYTALESFNSALESEIYWDVNPLGFEPKNIVTGHGSSHLIELVANSFYQSWHEAQEKTFDKKRVKIFVKN